MYQTGPSHISASFQLEQSQATSHISASFETEVSQAPSHISASFEIEASQAPSHIPATFQWESQDHDEAHTTAESGSARSEERSELSTHYVYESCAWYISVSVCIYVMYCSVWIHVCITHTCIHKVM